MLKEGRACHFWRVLFPPSFSTLMAEPSVRITLIHGKYWLKYARSFLKMKCLWCSQIWTIFNTQIYSTPYTCAYGKNGWSWTNMGKIMNHTCIANISLLNWWVEEGKGPVNLAPRSCTCQTTTPPCVQATWLACVINTLEKINCSLIITENGLSSAWELLLCLEQKVRLCFSPQNPWQLSYWSWNSPSGPNQWPCG